MEIKDYIRIAEIGVTAYFHEQLETAIAESGLSSKIADKGQRLDHGIAGGQVYISLCIENAVGAGAKFLFGVILSYHTWDGLWHTTYKNPPWDCTEDTLYENGPDLDYESAMIWTLDKLRHQVAK